VVERIQVPFFEPLFLELQNFVDSVAENTPPLVTAKDGYLALQLAEDIRQRVLDEMAYIEKPTRPMLARVAAN
jgi:predicted dehydrogenase